ncbi:MAG TPA: site-specific tyrosine recombinase XerD [Segeticoccus sp.]|uniref:site-specific tyrosine recombinase XerD n=1 Tax=Segeticoccus sp. TaxID=2706531 RepID=UPI002D80BA44|nr:site-specific tyrosine recombinase XerD [Segeticoccus sp.]HET8599630.1 site-specific tyrosine recombinase XerD [Segeticoccus sp.]
MATTETTTRARRATTPMDVAISGWLDHLRVERGASAHTLAAYRRDLRRYREFLAARGVRDPDRVGERDVTDFLASLREGGDGHPPLATSSATRTLVAARGLHRFLVREGVTTTDPAGGVAPARGARRLPKAISVDQVERLLQAASVGDTPASLRDRALLELLYAVGARVSEAVGLDVDDVDVDGERAVRLHGKGDKQRVVPLGRYAREAVAAYLVRARPTLAAKGKGTSALFLNQRGGRLSRQSAWTIIQQAAERAGLSAHVSPHTLRHSFATHLLDGGADVRVVQELLGHASVTTTQIYTLVTVQQLREVFAQAHPRAR